ncbi:hypothetical protein L7F22_020974 [Adiantum nelumboides]|nr:hypothetical protein [Adiantum nelumboides]
MGHNIFACKRPVFIAKNSFDLEHQFTTIVEAMSLDSLRKLAIAKQQEISGDEMMQMRSMKMEMAELLRPCRESMQSVEESEGAESKGEDAIEEMESLMFMIETLKFGCAGLAFTIMCAYLGHSGRKSILLNNNYVTLGKMPDMAGLHRNFNCGQMCLRMQLKSSSKKLKLGFFKIIWQIPLTNTNPGLKLLGSTRLKRRMWSYKVREENAELRARNANLEMQKEAIWTQLMVQ